MVRSGLLFLAGVAASATAAPPVARDVPVTVTTVSSEMLEQLPVGQRIDGRELTGVSCRVGDLLRLPSQPIESVELLLHRLDVADLGRERMCFVGGPRLVRQPAQMLERGRRLGQRFTGDGGGCEYEPNRSNERA